MELYIRGTSRTKRVAARKAIMAEEWTENRRAAWGDVRDRLVKAAELHHRNDGWSVLMFPDASDLFWGSFHTRVPTAQVREGLLMAEMEHEPLGFLSGAFKGSQLRYATVDKEAFAIVSTFRRLEYLLWDGVDVFCDHRNLAYIFGAASNEPPSKATAQRLLHWQTLLGQFRYRIQHIPGVENLWGTCCRG